MATTSAKVTILDPATGQITIVAEDADIFGIGNLAARPPAGTGIGDMYIVSDSGLGIYRIDLWDGAAWQSLSGGGGLSTVDTGNTLWVDAVFGNDVTALVDRQDLPWVTILSALAASSSGDAVIVRPGTYTESALTVPAGVALISSGGWQDTTILGAAATNTRVTLSAASIINGFTVQVPTNAGAYGVEFAAAAGVASANNLAFVGQAGAVGGGLGNTGSGKTISTEIRWIGPNDADTVVEATGGILAIESLHVPGFAGTLNAAVRLSGGARGQLVNTNSGAPTVNTGVQVLDAIFIGLGVNIFNCTNAVQISHNTADVRITGGLLEASTFNLLVDPGLTGVGGVTRIQCQMDPLFSIPSSWIDSDHAWTFFTKADSALDASYQLWGADWVVGHPEKGSGSSAGEGTGYSQVNTVLTTDATAGPASNGAGFVDVSVAAESKSGSTFGFQGVAAGHSILWCTDRLDASGNPIKHWGAEVDQVAAAVPLGGSFVCEIQTAANTWTEASVMSSSTQEQYGYGNQIFLRANSTETIRVGIDGATTWPATTISGTTGHWMRWRIDSTVVTAPTFERLRLLPSYTYFNVRGQLSAQGLAQWTSELFGTGNTWGEIAGTKDANIPVGSGGAPTGWTQKVKKARMDSAGDSISFQFQVPDGLCTAFPLYFNMYYSTSGGSPITTGPDLILSVLLLATGGVTIADPAGAVVPIARPAVDAEVFTSKAATTQTITGSTGAITETQQLMRFGPFDISEYYSGDAVLLRIEMDADGTPNQDTIIWSMTVDGVRFTTGGRL